MHSNIHRLSLVDERDVRYASRFHRRRRIPVLRPSWRIDDSAKYLVRILPLNRRPRLSVRRGMTRDERLYKDPDDFIPERFEKSAAVREDSAEYVFGFGRRFVMISLKETA